MLSYIVLISFLLLMTAVGTALVLHIVAPVPYVPTPMHIVQKMIDLADLQDGEVVYDLGAGDARLLVEAKRKVNITAIGYEYMPLVWMYGKIRAKIYKQDITFICGDAFKANFKNADVIFLYLFPSVMEKLAIKFDQELRPGTRVISHAFAFKNKEPVATTQITHHKRQKQLFLYQW